MMSMMHNQINRAFSTAIAERVIPGIHLQGTGTLRPVCPQIVRRTGNAHPGRNQILQKRTHGPRVI